MKERAERNVKRACIPNDCVNFKCNQNRKNDTNVRF